MDRRNSSNDDRTPQQPANPNVFDDQYALDPDEDEFMPAVSDGFRPGGGMSSSEPRDGDRQDHDRGLSPRPARTIIPSADGDLRRIASRNSTIKTNCARESVSLDRTPSGQHNRGSSSQTAANLQHHTSISSTGSFATTGRSESPFTTGPSHPYGMYPQNTMARNSSVTTTSTVREPHRSVSLQRPAHPYGMYPQNVVDEDEPPVPAVQSAIPVGFPGLDTGYHRRIGPDGEEQDIIGPDGHTEQLPPYSRYPEEGSTGSNAASKAALAVEVGATSTVTPVAAPLNASRNASDDASLSPVSPTSPAQPPPPPPPARQDTQSRDVPVAAVAVNTAPSVSSTEQGGSEKIEVTGSPQNWRKKKLWGKIPMSVALILLVLVLIFAIILGAAIGTYVAKKDKGDNRRPKDKDHNDEPSPQVTGPIGSLFDATPIPTPASLTPLPTGSWALPLGVPQESSKQCLNVVNQLSAWSCKMTFAPLVINIDYTQTGSNGPRPVASLGALPKPDGSIQYGIQTPDLGTQQLQLVADLDSKFYGPAWHFALMYDKMVVLNQDEFQAGASLNAATVRKREEPPYRPRFQVMPGEYPWYCYWNGTYIEGYIYANDNSTAASFTNFPSAWASNPYGSSVPVETGAPPTSISSDSASTPGPQTTPAPTPAMRRRGDSDYPRFPPYPRVVKIEERRLPGSPQPYCQKMRLLDDGTMIEALDNANSPIRVYLQERDPSIEEFFEAGAGSPPPDPSPSNTTQKRDAEPQKRGDPAGACHCQWMFQ